MQFHCHPDERTVGEQSPEEVEAALPAVLAIGEVRGGVCREQICYSILRHVRCGPAEKGGYCE